MKERKQIRYLLIGWILFGLVIIYFLKHFNLSWVETTEEGAKITVNFLFPMQKETFNKHLTLTNSIPEYNQFEYSVEWINQHIAEIYLKEKNTIKGQQVKLTISNAPTQFRGLNKSCTITVPFKTNVEILSPSSELLISSTRPFLVQFNTPMDANQISKSIQCNTKFYIKPYEITLDSGEKIVDSTKFSFIPKEPLENGKKYVLLFKAGMRAQSGSLLKQDYGIILKVDLKPSITKTYPQMGDKWIGLYPCFALESKEPIIAATATINGSLLRSILTDTHHAYFFLEELLSPETNYKVQFQTQVASGELSEIKTVDFTTTTISHNRFWMDIRCQTEQVIYCYEGNKCIKSIPYQIASKDNLPLFGTYYLQGKSEVYEENSLQIGANYWMKITDSFGIHGQERNAYWELSNSPIQDKNINLSDEDAAWLYEKMTNQAMIIVRK